MRFTISWAEFAGTVRKVYSDFTSENCFEKFDLMTDETKVKTILKTIGCALAAGIVVGLPLCFLSTIAGPLIGLTIAGVTSIGAFAYFTSSYELLDCFGDHAEQALNSAKNHIKNFFF